MRRSPLLLLCGLLAASGVASCLDPVHHDAVAQQGGSSDGPDQNGISPGPTHRAGEQCLVCHGGDGPGQDFAFAGTIYKARGGKDPFKGAKVMITDSTGAQKTALTNEVGNFYITSNDWKPTYPAWISVVNPTTNIQLDMISRIGGNGGCGFCHYGNDKESWHMPPVYAP